MELTKEEIQRIYAILNASFAEMQEYMEENKFLFSPEAAKEVAEIEKLVEKFKTASQASA